MDNGLQLPFECLTMTATAPFLLEKGQLISITNQFGLFLCTQGGINVSIDARRYHIKKGDLFFYTPTTLLRVLYVSDNLRGDVFVSSFDFIISISNKVLNVRNQLLMYEHPCISLTSKQYVDIDRLIVSLRDRIEQEDVSDISSEKKYLLSELIKSLAETLTYEVINIFFTSVPLESLPQDRKDKIFQNFLISLRHHCHKEREVEYYANEQCISSRYFSSIVKEKSGKTALQWIIQLVIIDAKHMLEYADISIKEIAVRLNFPSQSFFGKYFKKYVGVSPKEYRNKARLCTNEVDKHEF